VSADAAEQGKPAGSLRAHIRTRAFSQQDDYAFLGDEPELDWLSAYDDRLETSQPCMVLERLGQGWRLFVSGIPSAARQDFAGRRIRYAVVLEDRSPEASGMRDHVRRLIQLLLDGIASDEEYPAGFATLSAAFDEHFADDGWIARLRKARGDATRLEAEDQVRAVLEQLGSVDSGMVTQGDPAERDGRSWLWDVHDRRARAQFFARAGELLDGAGRRGDAAVIVNLVSTAEGLPRPAAGTRLTALANLAGEGGNPPERVTRQEFGGPVGPGKALQLPPDNRGQLELPGPKRPWWRRMLGWRPRRPRFPRRSSPST
jgi:hypothetical protein